MKPKIKNLKTSLHDILCVLINVFDRTGLSQKPSEDYSFKKNQILRRCGQNHTLDEAKQVQNSIF